MSNTVVLGIQARSTSERLPQKAHAMLAGERMLDRVLVACKRAAASLNKSNHIKARIAIACPKGDKIARDWSGACTIVEGPEHDVLSRYVILQREMTPDYVVRVTGDCPLLPPHVITGHVHLAVQNGYDYISNVDERWRTTIDGTDCEVISSRLLAWLNDIATRPEDREHVTTLARRSPPEWAKVATTITTFDMSHLKYSVDTPEDLKRAQDAFERASERYALACRTIGQMRVHRLFG